MKKRLMMALTAGALMVGMLPGVVAAASDQTNLGKCVSEAKQALQGTGVKLKVGQFDDIVLGTNANDVYLDNPPGPTLICGFGGNDSPGTTSAGDVFVGGSGADFVFTNVGTFIGGDGPDVTDDLDGGLFHGGDGLDYVGEMSGGFFDGGPEYDLVVTYLGGTCVNVEFGCPAP